MLRTVALGGVFSVVFSAAALAYVVSPNFSVTALTEGGSGAGTSIMSTGANFATGTCRPKSSAASYATSAQTTIGLNSGITTPVIGGGSSGGGIGGGGGSSLLNVTQSIM